MLRVMQSKKLTAAIVAVIAVMLAALVGMSIFFFEKFENSEELSMFLEGQYSIDDGAWQKIDTKDEINDNFHKAVFKGKLVSGLQDSLYTTAIISAKNVWFKLTREDGIVITDYHFTSTEDMFRDFIESNGPTILGEEYADKDYFEAHYLKAIALMQKQPNTPGYCIDFAEPGLFAYEDDTKYEYTLEVIYPYDAPKMTFSECFQVTLSDANGKYIQFFYHALPPVLLFLLVCFFGLFFFPIASFILGKKDYKYLSFGVLCFFWGLFMIVQNISGYLNMWISDPTACLLIDKLTNYFFIISIFIYLKSNLEKPLNRAIGNIVTLLYLLLIILLIVLHFTVAIDIYASTPYAMAGTGVSSVILAALLVLETRSNKKNIYMLISWIPLVISVIIDAVDHYLHFSRIDFFVFGLSVTILYQLVRLVLDLRTQYTEAIRYQQMQKELYEAKVSVMVSQIQPHFMYNALSSIAMLCKLDPETAYQATITFSQYLRSNMDSLKQTTPIPFEKELEHLKKYLYIEKLRFGKKLNIVYDIQTTDFELPQLSIQPLAENAVKHGISKKRGGGTLTIATKETDTAYEIIVSDDGLGFDPNEVKNDGRSHIGMENIRRRLKEMCDAEVEINSVIGEGTVAKVIIPKEERKNEDSMR